MKTFISPIPIDATNRGLRRDHRNPRNRFAWKVADNVKVLPEGLVSFDPILTYDLKTILDYGLNFSWPYPQIFHIKKDVVILNESRLFYVDQNDFALQPCSVYDYYSQEQEVKSNNQEPAGIAEPRLESLGRRPRLSAGRGRLQP